MTQIIRTLPLALILVIAAVLQFTMFDASSGSSVGVLWLGFILITIMLYLKFDFIKLDDSYDELSFKEEWSDYFLAAKMLGYLPWSLFLGFVILAFVLRSA